MADALQVTPDEPTGSARIVATINGADELVVERLVDGAWEPVRVMNPWVGDAAAGVRDFEVPFDVDVMYRLMGYDLNGTQVGATLTSGVVRVGSDTGDWLRPITRPLEGMRIWVESYPSLQRQGRVSTFDVLGSAERVALTATRGLPSGTLTVITMTDSERRRMLNMLASGEPLVFLTPASHGIGRQYLVVFNATENRIANFAKEQSRRWVLQVEEIGFPAGATAQWAFTTWADLRNRANTWAELESNYADWISVPETTPSPPPSPGGGTRKANPVPAMFGV